MTTERENPEITLFTNVTVFDGESGKLLDGHDVLVVGNLIREVRPGIPAGAVSRPEASTGGFGAGQGAGARVIDGGGRTLMPGLIDAHWHAMLAAVNGNDWMTDQPDYTHALMAVEAKKTLHRGFTTVRDTGGPGFGIKRAVDEGRIEGPRMFLSGALLSQTSGHADRTLPFEEPRVFSGHVPVGESMLKMDRVVNGPAEVLAAVRQNLKQGASQIKICLGGGVYSMYDPLDVTEFTDKEIKAAVDAAHVYQPKGIKRGVSQWLAVHRARPADGRGIGHDDGRPRRGPGHPTVRVRRVPPGCGKRRAVGEIP